ncbi:putative r3h domain protein [Botrytis fragariae]|uniref:Putative r3h domain protein n=1 Tax=Botrytis fragariae TaxID=1964551 RepID=A0A8H6B026_9HELO|nr:putative r3h domain protein [Botrytis fragariae]KAF5876816.1 putative r3h domain protein [Botrytis fragariae]
MAIVREIVEDSPYLQSLPTFCKSSERPLDDLDPHGLIAQSLICLREALELKRVKTLGALHEFSH